MSLLEVSHSLRADGAGAYHVVTSPGCIASIVVMYLFRPNSAAIC